MILLLKECNIDT